MPDTGERREITSRANAREAQTIQQSKKLLSKTKQLFAIAEARDQMRRAPAKQSRRLTLVATSQPDTGDAARQQKLDARAAVKAVAQSEQNGHTARPPALSSREDVRRAVRNVRRKTK